MSDYTYDKHHDIWYDSEGYAVNLEDIYGTPQLDTRWCIDQR